jgi:hypothetical protein
VGVSEVFPSADGIAELVQEQNVLVVGALRDPEPLEPSTEPGMGQDRTRVRAPVVSDGLLQVGRTRVADAVGL